jgi:ATP synthase F1 delta subunit
VPELHELLRNPQVDRRAKANALDGVLADSEELVRNFLRLLAEKGRAGEVDEIAREFERLVAREQGRLEVELTTAIELSDDDAKAIRADRRPRPPGRVAHGRRVRAGPPRTTTTRTDDREELNQS